MAPKKSSKEDASIHERAIWRGSISFGLVQIPIGLFRAESGNELHFTMLDKKNLAPVRYERKNGQTGKPIKWSDIVKGYEYQRGSFIVMTDADFAAANVKATGGIDIIDFVEADEVDPLYYSKPYYILPQDKAAKTYVLLREALRKADKVGVAKIVIRTRQHLALVRVYGDALVLELIRFPHELRPAGELKFPPKGLKVAGISEREVAMAKSLIDSMTGSWDPSAYRDDYHDDLLALIERKKRQGNKVKAQPAPKPAAGGANPIDIMELLQRSVAAKNGKQIKERAVSSKSKSARPTTAKKKAKAARKPTRSRRGAS